MTELAFLILLTFASGNHLEQKMLMCVDAHCVGKFERSARQSTTLTRFRVFERGRDGFVPNSPASIFPPIIDWSPG